MKYSIKVFLAVVIIFVAARCDAQRINSFNVSEQMVSGVPQIQLNWQTINEDGLCTFYVERDSNNSGTFTLLQTVGAIGFSAGATNYFYPDFGPLHPSATYCYRLRLDTLDYITTGACYFNSITDTLCVLFTSVSEIPSIKSPILIYPNPTSGKISLSSKNTISTVEMFDILGKKIYQSAILSLAHKIDLSNQPAGIYFLRASTTSQSYVTKVIKQ